MLKYSKQREIIELAVISSKTHPSAIEVYNLLHPLYPNLSLGTVYRNLTLLTGKGVIRKLHMPDGSDHFDGSTHDHSHALCLRCGKIEDISASFGSEFANMVQKETGFAMTGSQLIITGFCESCLEKENDKNA
ncbi:MAG: transcriptional repressor [Clostridiales bacterium]|jgi:Fur family peroxide stress response transcriptional regulator|nr:transcriptional repressor [Clostridiales bacterium]